MFEKREDKIKVDRFFSKSNLNDNRSFFLNKHDKKGQVTIFIIVGIMIMVTFLLVMFLVGQQKKIMLSSELEKVMTKALEKEGLRIYVEDCLEDELKKGITLIGKQGRLWSDQPGGIIVFDPGQSGVLLNGEVPEEGGRVFYGIRNQTYPEGNKNAYPCNDGSNPPAFCKYEYPDNTLNFGSKPILSKSSLEGDLRRFLINRTYFCVNEFIKSEVSTQARIGYTKMDMELDLVEDGIGAKVTYPLTVTLGKDNFYTLTNFDFFYPTVFYKFMERTLLSPLKFEQNYVTFDFVKDLKSGEFSYEDKNCAGEECIQKISRFYSFPFTMDEAELLGKNGDKLYTFRYPAQEVNGEEGDFKIRIALQNRPPALDYISHCPVDDYDYQLFTGENIVFTPNAKDPDGDKITYSYEYDTTSGVLDSSRIISFPHSSTSTEDFTFKVTSNDNYGNKDWQDVRVKVTDKLKSGISIKNMIPGFETPSLEDPYCVDVSGSVKVVSFRLNGQSLSADQHLWDPLKNEICNLKDYNNEIDINKAAISGFSIQGEVSGECGYNIEETVPAEQCVPYVAIENGYYYPFPYVLGEAFHLYGRKIITGEVPKTGPVNEKYSENYRRNKQDINPFLATRSCCNADGSLTEKGMECFNQAGCFETGTPYLKQLVLRCDGTKGNICGFGQGISDNLADKVPGKNICGSPKFLSCEASAISENCREKEAWSIDTVRGVTGWCNGDYGCKNFCTSEIVFTGAKIQPLYNYDPIKNKNNLDCGCNGRQDGTLCDKDFKNQFDGLCESGVCIKS